MSEASSPLLELPAELRNNIYAMVLEDTAVYLSRTSNKPLATKSALPRVNKQILEEFLSIAVVLGGIHASVLNFNFSHIVTFINKLSEAEMRTLSTVHIPSQRTFTIALLVERMPATGSVKHKLDRWLKRTGTTKKGTNLDIRYEVSLLDHSLSIVRTSMRNRGLVDVFSLMGWADECRLMANGRQKAEFLKIIAAIREAGRRVHTG